MNGWFDIVRIICVAGMSYFLGCHVGYCKALKDCGEDENDDGRS